MKFKFNRIYFIYFLVLLGIEILIAGFLKSGFIRHTVGDFLVVILLFCFFKSFLKIESIKLGMAPLIIAYYIEFLQLTDFLNYLGLKNNTWANLLFGNYFSIQDLLAYSLGTIAIVWLSKLKPYKNVEK